MEKINLHTHSTFCDGHNTLEENVIAAIEKGFTVLGFSSHSMYPFAETWHISPNNFQNYVSEVRSLAKKYEDKIKILCGFEVDYIPNITLPSKKVYKELNPDYLIGSVHYVTTKDSIYSVDNSTSIVKDDLIRLYGKCNNESENIKEEDYTDKNGKINLLNFVDGKKAVCEYFAAQREMLKKGDFEIWGHPDVIRKRNGLLNFFTENEDWYIEELKATANVAAKTGVIAEINTGGIARGAIDDFYPSERFLEIIHERNIPVMVNSDAHNAPDLDCAFEEAKVRAKKIGYKELTYPVAGSLIHINL